MRLALMRIQLDGNLSRRCAGVGEVLRPPFHPESEKVLDQSRLFAPLELCYRPKPVDVAAIENKSVPVLFAAVRHGSVHRHVWEF